MGIEVLYRGLNFQGVMWTTHLNLKPRSRMRGTIPSLPLYVFMSLTGTNFCFFVSRWTLLIWKNDFKKVFIRWRTFVFCSCNLYFEIIDSVAGSAHDFGGSRFEYDPAHRLCSGFSWVYSVSPGKFLLCLKLYVDLFLCVQHALPQSYLIKITRKCNSISLNQ
jgi:hypothetical protein